MIETHAGLLNEIISNMAKKFEEEKKELEVACSNKDAEIAFLKSETDARNGQLQAADGHIRSLEENLRQLQEQKQWVDGEIVGLRKEMEELKQAHAEELANRDRARNEELEKEKQMIEATIRDMDRMMNDERSKWREALRVN